MERVLPVLASKVTDEGRLRAFVAELGLKPGQTVEARVAAMLSDGLARLIIDDRPLDVRTPQPLPVGQTLTLTVERQGQALRLILGSLPPAEATRPASAGSGPPPVPPAATAGIPPSVIGAGASAAASTVAAQILIAQAAGSGGVSPPAGAGTGLAAASVASQSAPGPAAAPPGPVQTAPAQTSPAPAGAAQTAPAQTGLAQTGLPQPAGASSASPAAPAAPPAAATGLSPASVTPGPAAAAAAGPAAPAAPLPAASGSAPAAPPATSPAAAGAPPSPSMTTAARETPRASGPNPAAPPAPTSPPAPAHLPAAGAAGAVAALVALAARDVGTLRTGMDGARIATAARGAAGSGRPAGARDGPERPELAPRAALTTAVRQAAGRQESLAPLFADLAAVAEGRAPAALRAMPEPVLRAMAAVLGFRLPVEAAAAPQALARAVAGSGIFLEARLAALPPGTAPPPDLKAALAGLREALADWRMALPAPPAEEMSGPTALARPGLHARPPLRGSLPEGQGPAAPAISAAATPSEVALILADKTESALARILLLQAASLPGSAEAGRPDTPSQTMVEVPLRIGAETAVMQMVIVRDEGGGNADGRAGAGGRSWTLRFSMDAEPLGPIHASVTWHSGHVAVQLWAERDGTAERLAMARAALSEALEASAFTIDDLTIASGRPADPERHAPPPRLDRRS